MKTVAICLVVFLVTSVLFINFCNLVYGCGCESLWAGAATHCNIHAKHGKHCPWCSHGEAGYGMIFSAVLLPEFGVAYLARRRYFWSQLGLAMATFPVSGSIVALIVGLMDGYWKS